MALAAEGRGGDRAADGFSDGTLRGNGRDVRRLAGDPPPRRHRVDLHASSEGEASWREHKPRFGIGAATPDISPMCATYGLDACLR